MGKELDNEIIQDTVQGDATKVPVQPGDTVTVTLTAEESRILSNVKRIKEGKFKVKEEAEDIVDVIDDTLNLQVPAVDGAVVTVEIPADADTAALDDITIATDEETLADIITLVGEE